MYECMKSLYCSVCMDVHRSGRNVKDTHSTDSSTGEKKTPQSTQDDSAMAGTTDSLATSAMVTHSHSLPRTKPAPKTSTSRGFTPGYEDVDVTCDNDIPVWKPDKSASKKPDMVLPSAVSGGASASASVATMDPEQDRQILAVYSTVTRVDDQHFQPPPAPKSKVHVYTCTCTVCTYMYLHVPGFHTDFLVGVGSNLKVYK